MLIDLIKAPVVTEKYVVKTDNKEQNTYAFDVDVRLTKPQIKKLFEQTFNVSIISVNTYIAPAKKKRLGLYQGYKNRYKRAIIKLKPEQELSLVNKPKELALVPSQ